MKSVITILFSLSALLSFAQTDSNNSELEFKQRLKSVSDKNRTICCDFTQTKKVKNIKQSVMSCGQFFYDNSGLMALIYDQPKGDRVVMNDETFTIVANGKKLTSDAAANPMMVQISFMMQACMSGDVSKLGRGWDMGIEKNKDGYLVVLAPNDRRVKKYISGITMLFDDANTTLNKLRIEETSGGYTEYRFVNKKLNQKIDSSYFKME